MRLREIAHSRTGDKGDTSNISVIAFDQNDFALIAREVTADRVNEHFKGLVTGEVLRYELPQLGALNFVMRGALRGGDPIPGLGCPRQMPRLRNFGLGSV